MKDKPQGKKSNYAEEKLRKNSVCRKALDRRLQSLE